MGDIGRDPAEAALDSEVLAALKAQLLGAVVLPGDPEWAKAAQVWHRNPLATKTPKLIVRPRGTKDVAAVVQFAKQQGLEFAVKSGGHSPVNGGLCDGGITIDLEHHMHSCFVDPIKKIAIAEGGSLLADVDAETSLYKLAVPLGVAPVTGMGLAINGGLGLAARAFGITAAHILAATVVTADGSVVHVDEEHNSDLLWAIKGAGSAFGIVTKLTFQLHDVSDAYSGMMAFPDAPEHNTFRTMVKFLRDEASKDTNLSMNVFRTNGPHGPMIGTLVMYLGDKPAEEKAAFLAPVRALGPMMDTVGQWDYYQTQNAAAPILAGEDHNKFDYTTCGGFDLDQLGEEFLDTLVKRLDEPQFNPMLTVDLLGGAIRDTDAPVGFRDCEALWGFAATCTDPADTDKMVKFVKDTKTDMAKFGASNMYANFVSDLAGSSLAVRVGGEENLNKLKQLKMKWDPENIIRHHPFGGLGSVVV